MGIAWKRAAALYRQASRMWRLTVIEQQDMLDHLRKMLLEADRTGLDLSMRLGEALARAEQEKALCDGLVHRCWALEERCTALRASLAKYEQRSCQGGTGA